jgi:hypothetical protein
MGVELPNALILSIGIEDCGSDYPLTIVINTQHQQRRAISAALVAARLEELMVNG